MFPYSDPAERNFLDNSAVAGIFQQQMQGVYEEYARRINSGFTWLEAFQQLSPGQLPQEVSVDWSAFPITARATDEVIDRDRFEHQDEYVEWRAEREQNKLIRMTFTTEFPEYFEAFAAIGFNELANAIQDAIPGANPTIEEVFGPGFNPASSPPRGRIRTFRNRLAANPWNNGKNGLLCLTQQFNTLGALFNLLAACSVLRTQGTPENACSLVGDACGPARSSDPALCATAQRSVRGNLGLSLRDPAGVRIVKLDGIWKINNNDIDINDPARNQGSWVVSRNGRRAVLTIVAGLTVDGSPVITGAQIARKLKVAADLFAVPNTALPEWARTGVESSSRGPG
jgi:hypothetical protein